MKKIITYGSFDTLHFGHINLLKRCKELGDYLVVGLSTDEFNILKGKRSLLSFEERLEHLKSLNFIDLIIPETSWTQKKEDIKNHKIDLFAIGEEWKEKFSRLRLPCKAVYLSRTANVSSTIIRNEAYSASKKNDTKLKLHGTYTVEPSKYDDIFPLVDYEFLGHKVKGPHSFQTMANWYGVAHHRSYPLDFFHKTTCKFDISNEKYDIRHFEFPMERLDLSAHHSLDFHEDGIFCDENRLACAYRIQEGGIIRDPNGYVSLRKCCRMKKNQVFINTCKFLERQSITYFIYWGTLLGCLRHKGDIPWDRDHDIYVLEEDFFKLKETLEPFLKSHNYIFKQVRKNWFQIIFSRKNHLHLDIYLAEKTNG